MLYELQLLVKKLPFGMRIVVGITTLVTILAHNPSQCS